VRIKLPENFEMPADGVHIRLHDWPPTQQEFRLQRHKLPAALAFARANGLDRVVVDGPNRRLGIVTTGKCYLDVRQALDDLGIDDRRAAEIGLCVYKVGLSWPLEPEGIRRFAEGLEEILVVEEKRAVIETQIKDQLYAWPADVRPDVIGKHDESGDWLLSAAGELTPAAIARVIARRIERFHSSDEIKARLAFLEERERTLGGSLAPFKRQAYFCSGCPHNTSTRVPDGSRAVAGIGCHFMATWMDRGTDTHTHMGGEGANWIGIAPFTDQAHVFVNIGDGTYFHSGLLAIRAAVAAGVNVTYKILFNDAVAMTGGQPMDGPLDVPMITRQVAAEGVERIVVVTDEPEKYGAGAAFAPGTTVSHRDGLDTVQRDLRAYAGPSVLVYDQTCAAEKRRRRKRGLYPDPPKRAFINEAVCEGCGDCGVQSNCVSIVPKETPYGRKRAIDQSSCNKDFSCLNGFCPSFVTVNGGRVHRPAGGVAKVDFPALPDPVLPSADRPYGIVVAGIGGTGVVTIGALLGMAAHLEGKGVSVLDQIGLAQKNGAVVTHVRIAERPDDIHAVRISAGGARVLMGCDIVASGSVEILGTLRPVFTRAVVNTHATMTADFTHAPDLKFPGRDLRTAIEQACGEDNADFVDAGTLATTLLGDSIAANLFIVGFAYQKGLLPVSAQAIERAIEINATAADFNKQAFLWGRRTAHDKAAVERAAGIDTAAADPRAETLDEIVARRIEELTAYHNAAYAARYAAFVDKVRQTETERVPGSTTLAEAVARSYFKLLATKDEYEVARLYTDGRFEKALRHQFDGDFTLTFHLAPPILGNRDPLTGALRKRAYGPWVMKVFRILARLKALRGTPFDIFGYTPERKMERQLIADYETTVKDLLADLDRDNHAIARDIAALPETIRGFGHVKERNLQQAKAREADLLEAYRRPAPKATAAE